MLTVKEAGFFSTIQDNGRHQYRHLGGPVSGAMDRYSARIANYLLENQNGAALLEMTMTGAVLEFEAPTYVAITGADMSSNLNGEALENYEVHKINPGDILSFRKLKYGLRSYLALKGGIKTEAVLNSRSFYKPITKLNRIRNSMQLDYEPCELFEPKISHIKPEAFWKKQQLNVFRGPEFHVLDDHQLKQVFSGLFSIAKEYNRMAYQLKEPVGANSHPMLTSATLPGTVQLTPSGKLIILMRDGQTTGGYPRILQLSNRSMNVLAQKKFGDEISFKLNS